MILLKISILLAFLITFILWDAYLIKKGKHIAHGWNAFKTIFLGLIVLGFDERDNLKLFSYMFIYLSWWWLLFDMGLNWKRNMPLDHLGKKAILDQMLRWLESKRVNQFIIKIALIIVSLAVFWIVNK